jgi:serine/threonine protein kinase/Flp pilus assembly protein TadD
MSACSHCHIILPTGATACPHDGGAPVTVELVPVPDEVAERFDRIEPYAHGRTGTSYRAVQRDTGFAGLLKVLPLGTAGDASERARLKRELRKQSKLVNDSLVRIVDGGEVGSVLWLFRDFAPGESLAARLRSEGPLPNTEALAVLAQIASGLDELHRAGLLHRDVKPAHVILEAREGKVPLARLIDAGIAARIETGQVLEPRGTPAYIAPEQIEGKLVSFRSDLYSLGCLFYEALTGKPPFAGDDMAALLKAHRETPPPSPPEQAPQQARSLMQLMLSKDPRGRPFSAQQVRRTLEPLLPESTPAARSAAATVAGTMSAPKASGPLPKPGELPPVPGFAREDSTRELDIQDLEPATERPDKTEELDLAMIASMRVTDGTAQSEAAESAAEPEEPPTLQQASPLAANNVIDDDAPTLAPPATRESQPPEPAGEAAVDPLDTAPTLLHTPSSAPPRPSVNFDVESLFDGEPGAAGAPLAARPEPAGGHPAPPAPVAPEPAAASAPNSDDRTMVVPYPSRQLPVKLIGGAIAALAVVLLFLLFSGGDEEPAATAETEPEATSDEQGTARAPETAQAPTERQAAAKDEPAADEQRADEAEAEPEAAADEGADEGEGEGADEGEGEGDEQDEEAAAEEASAEAAEEPAPKPAKKAARRARKPRSAATTVPAKSGPSSASRAETLRAEAKAHYMAKRYPQAAAAYQKATRADPSHAGAYAGLGASLLAQGKAKEAVRAYEQAIQRKPRSSGFYAALGRAYARSGDKLRARSAYQKSLKLNPKNRAASRGLEGL